jgi:two-component system sensor histidine kinase PilS (NtrC family)
VNERTLVSFVVTRTVIATTLFLAALIIQSLTFFTLPLNFLFYLTALIYLLNVVYLVLRRVLPIRTNLYIQNLGDLILETVIVYLTGSLEGSFSFLYLVTILVGSIYLYRRGGLILAAAATMLYGALIDLQYYGIIPPLFAAAGVPLIPLGRIYYNLAANILGFFLVALLASFISERLRAAHEALSSTQARYSDLKVLNEAIVSSVSSALIATDLEGRIIFQNGGARAMFGPLQSLGDVFFGRTLSVEAVKGELLKGKRVRQMEVSEAGKNYLLRMTGLADARGEVLGILLLLDDITEYKALENELKDKEKMAAIGSLSAAIAHEIRNPLASISGSVQILTSSALQGQERKLTDIIGQETFRLNRIIENFILFARPKPLTRVPYSVTQQLKDFHLLLSHSPERASHEVRLILPEGEIWVEADRDMLQQVWWNLVRNAFRAMGNTPGALTIQARQNGSGVRIAFSDTGPGIPPEKVEEIFQPFAGNFREGLGIGLALCRRVVREHGGTIEVASVPHERTTFEVGLPLCTES